MNQCSHAKSLLLNILQHANKNANHGSDKEATAAMQQLVKTCFHGNENLQNIRKQHFLISPQQANIRQQTRASKIVNDVRMHKESPLV
jgi:hypothetical protein